MIEAFGAESKWMGQGRGGWVGEEDPKKQAKKEQQRSKGLTEREEIRSWKLRKKDLHKENHGWCPMPSEDTSEIRRCTLQLAIRREILGDRGVPARGRAGSKNDTAAP